MAGFPGLDTGFDGSAVFTPESCEDTLKGLAAHGTRMLIVLVERDELDEIGFALLERTAKGLGLAVRHFPIVDYSVPSDDLRRIWEDGRAERQALLRGGGTLAFSCQYGAGRSGLMASWTLMEAGLGAVQAMDIVRGHFPEAVESEDQEAWLLAQEAGARG